MKPGIVFSSLTTHLAVRRGRRSRRAPSPRTRSRRTPRRRARCTRGDRLRGEVGRDDELHPALVVLRLEVVPLVAARRSRRGATRSATRLPRTPHSTSTPATNSSIEHLLVVAPRELDGGRRARRRRAPSRCRPTSRAAPASRTPGSRTGCSTASPSRSVTLRATGMPRSRSTALKRSLSMQSAEAATPAPTYGTSASSSSPWTVPSSPNGPVQDREDDVDARERLRHAAAAAQHRERLGRGQRLQLGAALPPPARRRAAAVAERPAPVAADLHRDDLVAARSAPRPPSGPTRARSRARSSGRPAARRRADGARSRRRSRSSYRWSWSSAVVVGAVVGATYFPTVIVTVRARLRVGAAGRGSGRGRRRPAPGFVVVCWTTFTWKPACWRSAFAVPWSLPGLVRDRRRRRAPSRPSA